MFSICTITIIYRVSGAYKLICSCVYTFICHLLCVYLDEPKHFMLEVRPSNNYPIDLYLLMDLSFSMRDDLAKLKTLGAQLCKS